MQCGVYEGSVLGARHIIDYFLRPLYMSFIVMADEIKEEGLDDAVSRLCMWYTRMVKQRAYKGMPEYFATADDFNNDTIGFIAGALLMRDKKKASIWLGVLKDWLDNNMTCSPGVLGLYKEDGTVFHHCGHYPTYGVPALTGTIPIIWALSDTPYAVSEKSWANTRKALETLKFSSTCGNDDVFGTIPLSFSGRCPHVLGELDYKPFKYFALAAPFYNDKPVSEEKSGNKSMYMACTMAHRYNNRLVIMRGFSKYLWAGECYSGCNMYDRYFSFGTVEILSDTLKESGYNVEGYDFRHLPGSTAIISDWDDFKTKLVQVDEYATFEELLLSDQSFAGGVSDGANGMFSAILAEHPKYNGTHRAIKSGFFVDDFLLFIGSNINNVSEYPTETTLFQNYIGDKETDNSLTDIIGNVYYIPEGQETEVREENQNCPLSTGNGFAEGRFKTAVIKHGIPSYRDNEKEEVLGDMYKEYAEKLRIHIDKIGIECNQAHAPFSLSYGCIFDVTEPKYLWLIHSLESAAILGAENIIVHSISVPKGVDFEEYNINFYKSLIPYCEKFGIHIAVENLFAWDSKRKRRIGKLGSPRDTCMNEVRLILTVT